MSGWPARSSPSTPRCVRPATSRCRSPSATTPTCSCPARPARPGTSRCPCAPRPPSTTAASRPARCATWRLGPAPSATASTTTCSADPRILRLAGDDRLVALVRAGNEAAFEVVYDRYHLQLLSFCRHMLGRAAEAEDAVLETFICAYGDLRRSERPIALRAWLFTIARNRCLSMLRSRRETASLEDVEPETAGLAAEVQHRDELRTMLGDISRLPEDQRTALVLAELGDLDHAEIAGVIGCSKDKVKALVFQARSSLSLSRQARETSCEEIREQLSTLRGGALRRAGLRRHLHGCAGCRDFRDEARRQPAAVAVRR